MQPAAPVRLPRHGFGGDGVLARGRHLHLPCVTHLALVSHRGDAVVLLLRWCALGPNGPGAAPHAEAYGPLLLVVGLVHEGEGGWGDCSPEGDLPGDHGLGYL